MISTGKRCLEDVLRTVTLAPWVPEVQHAPRGPAPPPAQRLYAEGWGAFPASVYLGKCGQRGLGQAFGHCRESCEEGADHRPGSHPPGRGEEMCTLKPAGRLGAPRAAVSVPLLSPAPQISEFLGMRKQPINTTRRGKLTCTYFFSPHETLYICEIPKLEICHFA